MTLDIFHEKGTPVGEQISAWRDLATAAPLTKIHALAVMAAEQNKHDYYRTVGPMFADPLAGQLYAEIASIEEQHVTQYESIIDPDESWLEKWLLHEVTEVWVYWSCAAAETNLRIRSVYERFVSYELGQLHAVIDLARTVGGRDPHEILPTTLPTPIAFESQRAYVRGALERLRERAVAPDFARDDPEPARSGERRDALSVSRSPSEIVAAGYQYTTAAGDEERHARPAHGPRADVSRRARALSAPFEGHPGGGR